MDFLSLAVSNGITPRNFRRRLERGWSEVKAATEPVGKPGDTTAARSVRNVPRFSIEILELAAINGISYETFQSRVTKSGWDEMTAATTPVMTNKQIGKYGNRRFFEKYGLRPGDMYFPHRAMDFEFERKRAERIMEEFVF